MTGDQFLTCARLTVDDAAEIVGMSPRELTELIKTGLGPAAIRYGATDWVSLADLNRWIRTMRRTAA